MPELGFMDHTRRLMELIHQRMSEPSSYTESLTLGEIHELVKGDIDPRDRCPVGATAMALNMLIIEHTVMLEQRDRIPTFRLIRRYRR